MMIVKNSKALSPVIASIILVGVAVAVSIAVAAWMGALTFTFTETAQLEILGCTFNDVTPRTVTLAVQNTGTTNRTVSKYKIGVRGTPDFLDSTVSVAQGAAANIVVPLDWASGQTYDIYLITATGEQFPYRARAP
jgi:FlaG/FlaF family flagellin (archaellin)